MKFVLIGRNYAKHIKELNSAFSLIPLLFHKPSTAWLKGNTFTYPSWAKDIHYELEVVVKISKTGSNISVQNARKHYKEVTVGIDITDRGL